MRRFPIILLPLLSLAGILQGAEPQSRLMRETWEAAYLEGAKAGYVHTTVEEIPAEPDKRYRTSVDLNLSVKRFNDTAQLRMISGTEETKTGSVTAVFMRQFLGKQQQHVITGVVDDKVLHVRAQGQRAYAKDIPWDDRVIGLDRQERLYRDHHVKPGDRFSFLSYEPTVTAVVLTRVEIQGFETVQRNGGGPPKRYLRAQVQTEKIMNVQLPPLTVWLDDDLMPALSEVELPGLGHMRLERGTRAVALRPGEGGGRDLGFDQLIPIPRRILNPYRTEEAVYRVRVRGDADAGTAFAQDDRQCVRRVRGDTFELHVRARRVPRPMDDPPAARQEFMASNFFINSDDTRVRELARRAVGDASDDWAKAKRIERWVHANMQNRNFTENFATADHVARTLEGDCTEHAMLAAAMCRAAGVGSRTAVGLIYVDGPRGPSFGFHMWTEVWVQGQWMPIDATLGQNYVGATHLKVLDHSWQGMQTLTPLLPLIRVVGKASIEVLRVGASEDAGN